MKNAIIVASVLLAVIAVAVVRSGRRPDGDEKSIAASRPAVPTVDASGKPLPRLIELGAGKCQACRQMAPIIEELRQEYAGRVFVESVDVYQQEKRADAIGYRVMPTQVLIDEEGIEIWRNEGPISKEQIVEQIASFGIK